MVRNEGSEIENLMNSTESLQTYGGEISAYP